MSDVKKLTLDEIRETAARLVRGGVEVREKLRALTLQALTQGELAEREIRGVLDAITEGVSVGAGQRVDEVKGALGDALHGMDDAMLHAAEAMHLAISEVASDVQAYASQDLQQGLTDLKKLEELFLETVTRVAEGAGDLVKQEMRSIAEHGKNIGTDTGGRVKTVAEGLAQKVRGVARDAAGAGKDAAREVSARVAVMASKKLGEVATRLAEKAEQLKQK